MRQMLRRAALPAGALLFCALMPTEGAPRLLPCPFRLLTGLPCPLCGMTRALIALGHGQWRQAVAYHALSPLVFGSLAIWLTFALFYPAPIARLRHLPDRIWIAAFAGLVVFGALRWWGIIESPPA